jgi:HEAT repeat protein
LLTFLKRTDRDPRAQGSAVFALIRIAPDKPEVVAAIEEFLSRPLDSSSRIGALNALGIPSVKDVHLIAIVIASLDDSDYGVRYTAVQVLRRIGQHAVLQGQSRLQELAGDPAQPADIRAAAREALRTIRPG